uniref:Uncharacterized protein n=1 Tax=Rhizophora mucronata TaxID=61149 RepID=A0A2P2N9W7_RHIMU
MVVEHFGHNDCREQSEFLVDVV